MQKCINKNISIILTLLLMALFIPTISYASSEADIIKYSVDVDDELGFNGDDFNDECSYLMDEDLDYVEFELPDSDDGTLYYDYGGDDEEEIDDSDPYYYSSEPSIDDITFVPDEDCSSTVTIEYTGYDVNGDSYSGEVKISVDTDYGTAEDIEYSVDSGDTVNFDEDDFNGVCTDLNDDDADLNYVYFELPDSDEGTLYYDYDGDDEEEVDDSDKYYYDDDPSLSDITFVPEDDFSGTVTISYEGHDSDGNSFSGDVVIEVEDSDEDIDGDIEYSVDSGDTAGFDEDDFNDFCQDENDEDLNYVRFSLPASSKGVLYYDYGEDDEEELDEADKYYFDDDPSISDITFAADDDYSGDCEIDFEGYDVNGDSIEGTVVISVGSDNLGTADTIYFTGEAGSNVVFNNTYFNNECIEIAGSPLNYVKFTLPSSTVGTLYYGYTSANDYLSLVSASTSYYYAGTPYLSKVSFVSASGTAGTSTLNYTGYASNGSTFTGKIQITLTDAASVSGSSQYFADLNGAYSWAVTYIDSLYKDGIVTGSVASDSIRYYNPGSNITRGDFMLILSRELNLQSTSASGNFSDVAAGSYYYDAIAAAKAAGIAQGANNLFQPDATITREDAMVLAQRAMSVMGMTSAAGSAGDLASYQDYTAISGYAQTAISTLIKAGIITGSTDGQIHPKNSITRAEAAAIIYRIKY